MKSRISKAALLFMAVAGTVVVQLPAAERESQASGVQQFHITRDWQIHIPPSPHKALARAAGDLQGFLRNRHGLELSIVEGTAGNGITLAVNGQQKEDGFSLRAAPAKGQILVEGSSPRAVYQGVLLLEDYLAEHPSVPRSFNRIVVFPFKDRYLIWDALLTGQNKGAIGFNLERHVREAVRLGYTGMVCNRFVGMTIVHQGHPRDPYPWYTYWGPSMDQFVASPLFEGVFPKDYLARNLADLRYVVGVVESFGMKPVFMGYEPRFVPEAFLKQHPDLRGPRVDHPLRSMTPRYSLCTDQPEVLGHYRILARRLAEEVPALSEMHIIFHDSGAGLCWEKGGYPGRNGPAHCKNVPMGDRMRKFFTAIRQGFRDAGRDIALVAQPHGSSRGEIDEFFDRVPKEIDFTAGNWASWSLSYQDPLGIDRYVLSRQRATGRRTLYYQQHFFGFDVAPTSEFPLPYYLAERLGRARELGLDVLNTLGGIVSPPIKERSAMQEIYRQFLLEPGISSDALVEQVARDLGGPQGGEVLVAAWKDIHAAVESNGRQLGFGLGLEYASRRTLVRPLVPDPPALLPDEREWWQAYTFGGDLRFGHAHLFRSEGGLPPEAWYRSNHEQSVRASEAFQRAAAMLRSFLRDHPEAARKHPYLPACERQFHFIGYVYSTGANLYEGQRILDSYSRKAIDDNLKREVDSDVERFQLVATNEIENTQALLRFIEEGGDIGMVLLPEETTWGYSTNLPELLRRKIEIMKRHLPETREVLTRWFDSEY
jgi:hypothetical protein